MTSSSSVELVLGILGVTVKLWMWCFRGWWVQSGTSAGVMREVWQIWELAQICQQGHMSVMDITHILCTKMQDYQHVTSTWSSFPISTHTGWMIQLLWWVLSRTHWVASRTSSCHWTPQNSKIRLKLWNVTLAGKPGEKAHLWHASSLLYHTQQNQATPWHVHLTHQVAWTNAKLGWMENSQSRMGHCCLKGLAHYVPCPLTCCPNWCNSWHPSPYWPSCYLHHHGWTWGAIKSMRAPTELENSHMIISAGVHPGSLVNQHTLQLIYSTNSMRLVKSAMALTSHQRSLSCSVQILVSQLLSTHQLGCYVKFSWTHLWPLAYL